MGCADWIDPGRRVGSRVAICISLLRISLRLTYDLYVSGKMLLASLFLREEDLDRVEWA
jgi:hypothetical protein